MERPHCLYIWKDFQRNWNYYFFDRETLKCLYFTFVHPYLIHCNQVWGCACKSTLRRIVTLQKKAIRIMCGVKPREHTDPLFQKLKIMKVVDINTYLIGKTMYRWHTGLLRSIFNDHFVHNKNIHSTCTL